MECYPTSCDMAAYSIVSSSYFSTNQEGETALIKAALADEASVVTLLLDAKANVDHADNVRFA
jgi:ankyrin repeat protein